MTKMSHLHKFQNDLFQVLNEDHNSYLKLHQDYHNSSATHAVSKCKLLVDEINTICRLHTKNNQNPHDATQHQEEKRAVRIIQNFFIGIRNKRIFEYLKTNILELSRKNPATLLKLVNRVQAELFEKSKHQLVFRLDGKQFPPNIVYKLFHRQDKVNILTMKTEEEFVNGLYRKIRHGGWCSFNVYKCNSCKTMVKIRTVKKIKKKKRKLEDNYISWIKEMYLE